MLVIRRLLAFCLMLFFCFSLRSETLTIGIRNDVYDPGMLKATEWVKEAVQASGNKIEFRYLPAKRSLKLASIGHIDGEFYRHTVIESKYPNLERVDVSVGQFDYYVWILAENNCMENWQALAQFKPAGTRGVVFFESMVYPRSKVGYEEVASMNHVMEILHRGRADYTVHDPSIIEFHSEKAGIKLKKCFDEPLFSKHFYLYLHKSKSHLIEAVERALAENKH